MLRLLTACVLVPVLWVLIRVAPAWLFSVIAVGWIAAAAHECYRILATQGLRPFAGLGLVATVGVGWAFVGLPPRFDVALPLVLLVVLSAVAAMRWRQEPGDMFRSTMATLFPVLFVGLLLAHVIGLRAIAGEPGRDLVLLLFLCVIAGDTVAYYVGSALGRHRMAPRLSPRKSWEGAAGAVAGSIGAALLAHFWFYRALPLADALVLGIVLAAAGILGDLSESMVKRAAGVKDSSAILPGHGGVLDRSDSLLFASPLLYYYYRAFLQV